MYSTCTMFHGAQRLSIMARCKSDIIATVWYCVITCQHVTRKISLSLQSPSGWIIIRRRFFFAIKSFLGSHKKSIRIMKWHFSALVNHREFVQHTEMQISITVWQLLGETLEWTRGCQVTGRTCFWLVKPSRCGAPPFVCFLSAERFTWSLHILEFSFAIDFPVSEKVTITGNQAGSGNIKLAVISAFVSAL